MNPAITYMRQDEVATEQTIRDKELQQVVVEPTGPPTASLDTAALDVARRREKNPGQEESTKEAEDWRKSDSTMHTVRLVGSRTPTRPLSVAESSCSGHTVVPMPGRRMSALVTDAEFATPEVESEEEEEEAHSALSPVVLVPQVDSGSVSASPTRRPSPSSPAKPNHRRSLSLNLGSFVTKGKSSESYGLSAGAELMDPVASQIHNGQPTHISGPSTGRTTDTPTLTRTAANGIITPLNSNAAAPSQTTGNNIRGRLAAWTTTAAKSSTSSLSLSPTLSSSSHDLQAPLRSSSPANLRRSRSPTGNPARGLRQTAISMSNGFAPAAGLAMGFGKRAVDRLGRAWGGGNGSNASTTSGYSSSSSSNGTGLKTGGGTPPSSFFSTAAHNLKLGRTHSNQSEPSNITTSGSDDKGRGRQRHRGTPDGHSGTWSVTSSVSDGESAQQQQQQQLGPNLGKLLRAPMQPGLVFGRDLATCVRETAAANQKSVTGTGFGMDMEVVGARALESRHLPALVLRCAQHLEKWGVQEEGLFRQVLQSSLSSYGIGC